MIPLPENLMLTVASAIYDPGDHDGRADPLGRDLVATAPTRCKLAEFALSRKDPQYVRPRQGGTRWRAPRRGAAEDRRQRSRESGRDATEDTGIGSLVFASASRATARRASRRPPASVCWAACANIAEEYATKRYRSNVVNWGMLPFILDDAKNSGIQAGDVVVVRGIRKALLDGKTDAIPAELISGGSRRELTLSLPKLTADERDIILAGCLINYYAK